MLRATLVLVAASNAAIAQFEAASIKPTPLAPDGRYQVRLRDYPGRLEYTAASLKAIIQKACEVRDFQIAGPDWMASARFDVVAKLPANTPASGTPALLRALLAERFKMTAHRETRELPMFALVVAKTGVKMKEAAADDASVTVRAPAVNHDPAALDCGPKSQSAPIAGWMLNQGPGKVQGHSMNMASVANMLAALLGRFVVDQTDLKGNYDFDLEFAPDSLPDADGMPLLTAIQSQLGLKLEAKKGPVDVVVIDHIEKMPTQN